MSRATSSSTTCSDAVGTTTPTTQPPDQAQMQLQRPAPRVGVTLVSKSTSTRRRARSIARRTACGFRTQAASSACRKRTATETLAVSLRVSGRATSHVPSRAQVLAGDAQAAFDNTTVDGRSDVLLVARDPRSRLLAFYLHQIAPHAKGRRWCRYNPNCKGHARSIGFDPKRPPSFAQFVELVAKRAKQRGGDVCYVEHHLCSQVSGCLFGAHVRSTTVLKLEEMPLWYADFAAHVGIGPLELDGDQWLPYTNQSCFYSPQGGGCLPWDAWPRREAPGRSHSGGGSLSNDSVQWSVAAAGRHDPVHPTGASTLVSSYYGNVSSATSQLVAALYRDDYRLLGYASPKGRAKHHPFKFHETVHGVPQPQDTKVGELVRSDR